MTILILECMKKRTMNEAGRFLGTVLLCGGVVSSCSNDIDEPASKGPEVLATPYITKVLEFVPCPGQFVNVLPEFEEGDTQEAMNEKVLQLIGNNKRGTDFTRWFWRIRGGRFRPYY